MCNVPMCSVYSFQYYSFKTLCLFAPPSFSLSFSTYLNNYLFIYFLFMSIYLSICLFICLSRKFRQICPQFTVSPLLFQIVTHWDIQLSCIYLSYYLAILLDIPLAILLSSYLNRYFTSFLSLAILLSIYLTRYPTSYLS